MSFWVDAWYSDKKWLRLLAPLEALYVWKIKRKQRAYLLGQESVWQASVPVIVIGNITLGGTGKSPLVVSMVKHLQAKGYKPGIVSRGYKGKAVQYPLWVKPNTSTHEAGDEPVMLAQQTGVPVVVDPDRVHATQHLLNHSDCNIVISDDGLQHLRLGRDIEIIVIDGKRGLGNGHCLPAGPLREPPIRLQRVHYLVINGEREPHCPTGFAMNVKPLHWVNLKTGETLMLDQWHDSKRIHAVTGIGNPSRFFNLLKELHFDVIAHEFDDHYLFTENDIRFYDELPVIMTAKDAVKCNAFASEHHWSLTVEATVEDNFWDHFNFQLEMISIAKNCLPPKGA
jgi:tetraacyldisaccharide 4'-kinase